MCSTQFVRNLRTNWKSKVKLSHYLNITSGKMNVKKYKVGFRQRSKHKQRFAHVDFVRDADIGVVAMKAQKLSATALTMKGTKMTIR